jgi:hypothetical protein
VSQLLAGRRPRLAATVDFGVFTRLLDHVHFLGGEHDDWSHAQVDGRDIRARIAELDVLQPPALAWSRQLCSGA